MHIPAGFFAAAILAALLLPISTDALGTLTASTDKDTYAIGETVTLHGTVPQFVQGTMIYIKIFNAKDILYLEDSFSPKPDATYSYTFKLQGNQATAGSWVITVHYQVFNKVIGFSVSKGSQSGTPSPPPPQPAPTPVPTNQTAVKISTDKKTYVVGDTVNLIGTASPVTDQFILIQTFNPDNFAFDFGQVKTSQDGKFTYSFVLKGKLAISGNYTVKVSYQGKMLVTSVTVFEAGPPGNNATEAMAARMTTSGISLIDAHGHIKKDVGVGEEMLILTNLTNKQDMNQDFVFIVQVKDSNGVTVTISWIRTSLDARQTAPVSQSWTPDQKGKFTIEIFVWQNLSSPTPLANEVSSTLNVL